MIIFLFGRPETGKSFFINTTRRTVHQTTYLDDATPTSAKEESPRLLRAAADGSLVIIASQSRFTPFDYKELINNLGSLVQVQVLMTIRFVPGFDYI